LELIFKHINNLELTPALAGGIGKQCKIGFSQKNAISAKALQNSIIFNPPTKAGGN